MTPDKRHGNQDLSFRWRGASDVEDKFYFLFVVTDDHLDLDPPRQPKPG